MINNNSQIKENLSSTLKAMIADENLEINFSNIDNNFFSLDDSLIANNKINLPSLQKAKLVKRFLRFKSKFKFYI